MILCISCDSDSIMNLRSNSCPTFPDIKHGRNSRSRTPDGEVQGDSAGQEAHEPPEVPSCCRHQGLGHGEAKNELPSIHYQCNLLRLKVTPNLPEGPSHKLAANGYYTRDGRREVHPPTVLADGTKVITSL